MDDPFGEVVGYAYDAVGNRVGLTYPDGRTVEYRYDPGRRLTSVRDWDSQVTEYAYDAPNRLQGVTLPNGVISSYRYDPAGQLLGLRHERPAMEGQDPLLSAFEYTYDAVGNRVQVVEQMLWPVEGGDTPTPTPSSTPTATGTPSLTGTLEPTATTTNTSEPTATATATVTETPIPTPTGTTGSGSLDRSIRASADDTYSYYDHGWVNRLNDDDLILQSSYNGGTRFTDVTVPQGAHIVEAYVEVYVYYNDDPSLYLYAEDVDDSQDFSLLRPQHRERTGEWVLWDADDIGEGWARSPDIAALIQSVVDRPGWRAGNALSLLWQNYAGRFRFRQWDFQGEPRSARLHVEYESSAAADRGSNSRPKSAAIVRGSSDEGVALYYPGVRVEIDGAGESFGIAPAQQSEITSLSVSAASEAAIDFFGREYYTAREGIHGNSGASPLEIGDPSYVPGASDFSQVWKFTDGGSLVDEGAMYLFSSAGNRWSLPLQGVGSPGTVRLYVSVNHNSSGGSIYEIRAGEASESLTVSRRGRSHYIIEATFSGEITLEMECTYSSSSGASFWLAGAEVLYEGPAVTDTPSATATPTPTFTASRTATQIPTQIISPTASATATRVSTQTISPTASVTPTVTPTFAATATPTWTTTATPTQETEEGVIEREVAASADDSYAYGHPYRHAGAAGGGH